MIEFLVDQNFNEHIVDGLTRRDPALQFTHVRDVGLASVPDPVMLEWAAERGMPDLLTLGSGERYRVGSKETLEPYSMVAEPSMSTALVSCFPTDWTVADMQQQLGGIPLARIRMVPPPGTATEEDVLAVHARTGRLCELVDGTLVEKVMGYRESRLAVVLGYRTAFSRAATCFPASSCGSATSSTGLKVASDVVIRAA